MKGKYTVVIADDHPGIRSGITGILEGSGSFQVVGEAGDGETALQAVSAHQPDLLILDVKLPVLEGPEVASSLTARGIPTTILALSSYDLPEFVASMIQNGASGYLTKDQAPRWLSAAALDLLEGRRDVWVSKELRSKIDLDLD